MNSNIVVLAVVVAQEFGGYVFDPPCPLNEAIVIANQIIPESHGGNIHVIPADDVEEWAELSPPEVGRREYSARGVLRTREE